MRELPILMNGPMVRATLADLKTVTRRLPNMLLGFGQVTEFGASDTNGYEWHFRDRGGRWNDVSHERLLAACPYGQPGDRLWVRETPRVVEHEPYARFRVGYEPDQAYGVADFPARLRPVPV